MLRVAWYRLKEIVYAGITAISPEATTKIRYHNMTGKWMNLRDPRSFPEKISWLKLNAYSQDPKVKICADKYAVRQYVIEKGYGHLLNELYAVVDKVEDIPWERLPERVALKLNFGCGYNYLLRTNCRAERKRAQQALGKWIKRKHWLYYAELQYKVERKLILCERYLENTDGSALLDYKFYCFDGNVRAILVIDRMGDAEKAAVFMSPRWEIISTASDKYQRTIFPLCPKSLGLMIDAAEELSKGFPFVRIDFYECDGEAVFGEMTFTPAAGIDPSETEIDGKSMGEYILLSRCTDGGKN